jgi:hypothetical protein
VTNLGDGYRGYIHPEQVQLRGAEFEIRATEEYFEIGWKKRPPERWKMSELPTDKLIVFDGTSVVYEDLTKSAGDADA